MKFKILSIAAAAMLVAGGVQAAGVAAATGSAGSTSGSVAAAGAAGTGSATSLGFNQGYAKTSVAVDVNTTTAGSNVVNPPFGIGTRTTTANLAGNVEVHGVTETANMSGVRTTTSGPALAFAGAGGLSAGSSTGAGAFDTGSGGAPQGAVLGTEGSLSATGAVAVQNGSNLQNVGRVSYFDATASADRSIVTTQTVFLGIPLNQPSQSVTNNTATTAAAGSVNTGGFALPPAITNSGTAIGGSINVGAGAAAANSSSNGNVSALDIDLVP